MGIRFSKPSPEEIAFSELQRRQDLKRLCRYGSRSNLPTQHGHKSPFEGLPLDVQLKIVDSLTLKQKVQAELVCKSWSTLLRSSYTSISLHTGENDFVTALEWLYTVGVEAANVLRTLELHANNWVYVPDTHRLQCELTSSTAHIDGIIDLGCHVRMCVKLTHCLNQPCKLLYLARLMALIMSRQIIKLSYDICS